MNKQNKYFQAIVILAGCFAVSLIILLVQTGFAATVLKKIEYILGDTSDVSSSEAVGATSTNAWIVSGEEYKANNVPDFIDAEPPQYLTYLTTAVPPNHEQQYELYVGVDTQNKFKILHYKNKNYQATTTYPVFRVYPDYLSDTQIVADYVEETGSDDLPGWFGKQPQQKDDVKSSLRSDNLVVNDNGKATSPSWLIVPDTCFSYMPEDKCNFTITPNNPFALSTATLVKGTGPYKWPDHITPYAMFVTNDNKILIRWSFGDAGVTAKINSLWDPKANTHTQISEVSRSSEVSSIFGESSVHLPYLNKSYIISQNPLTASTSPVLKRDPFAGLKIYGEPLLSDCYNITFHPTDVADHSAKWLLEYEYGCYSDYFIPKTMIYPLSAWYELDPTTDIIRAISSVMPK